METFFSVAMKNIFLIIFGDAELANDVVFITQNKLLLLIPFTRSSAQRIRMRATANDGAHSMSSLN